MASGSDLPRAARADVLREHYAKQRRERELANTRVEIRAELRDSSEEEEDTGVIDQKMMAVQGRRELPTIPETPIPEKPTAWHVALVAVRRVPPLGFVILGALVIVAYTLLMLRGKLP